MYNGLYAVLLFPCQVLTWSVYNPAVFFKKQPTLLKCLSFGLEIFYLSNCFFLKDLSLNTKNYNLNSSQYLDRIQVKLLCYPHKNSPPQWVLCVSVHVCMVLFHRGRGGFTVWAEQSASRFLLKARRYLADAVPIMLDSSVMAYLCPEWLASRLLKMNLSMKMPLLWLCCIFFLCVNRPINLHTYPSQQSAENAGS